jgi:hypothetical protein
MAAINRVAIDEQILTPVGANVIKRNASAVWLGVIAGSRSNGPAQRENHPFRQL